jgi:hypothetical protein
MLLAVNRDILIRIVIGYGLHNLGIVVLFPAGARGVSHPQTCSRPGLGSMQPPSVQWVLRSLSLGLKWLECDAYHAVPAGADI